MRTLTIEAKNNAKKGRTFSGSSLAHICANELWEGGRTETHKKRPVFIVFGGEETTLRPFMANFRDGVEAVEEGYSKRDKKTWEILRSAPMKSIQQRTGVGVLHTLYFAPLFDLDPNFVPSNISFVCMVGGEWAREQKVPSMPDFDQWYAKTGFNGEEHPLAFALAHGKRPLIPKDVMRSLIVEASLFRAYLERRTTLPLPADPLFTLHLYVSMLAIGAASLPETDESTRWSIPDLSSEGDLFLWARHKRIQPSCEGLENLGVGRVIACYVEHKDFMTLASQEVQRYRAMIAKKPKVVRDVVKAPSQPMIQNAFEF